MRETMKKILFATTALVATAGVAAADVALSGWAEMGVIGGSDYYVTQFHTDIDVTFKMSGTADNGLTFGASIDLDESDDNDAFDNEDQGGETIFVAYGGFKLTMGDTDGAFDAAMQEVNFGGSINDDESGHVGFSGNSGLDGDHDGQIATASYSSGPFTGYLSAEIDDCCNYPDDTIWGIGAKVSMNGVTIGAGHQFGDDEEHITGVSVTYSVDGISAGLNWSSGDVDGDEVSHVGVGVGYTMNALTLAANYGVWDYDGDEESGWGVSAGYDLGGGLSAHFGYGSSNIAWDDYSYDTWSIGLAMSF
jgi:outer membrane protein OmpU